MDIRHEEFMAMADAFLGPHFDRAKLAQVESLQLHLHDAQARLTRDLDTRQIGRSLYVDELNKVHAHIAQRCEAILGSSDFEKLFGISPSEAGAYIDKDLFLTHA